ncbi:uncharacterized protein B0P05DRAFT_468044 [Gilbertella persicaria]|uniref:uncharacterized protein n=1 Tax=Gilbertella persicaria TaxID=101096 RepID=UPI002220ECF8|nr:uncharacterized protein B0P05DRAFT_468044 [Gilbertella persicaria]KAI8082503.1 hypothetical protein B0P05DRAFT_468044 [Gilbertella persicaria]
MIELPSSYIISSRLSALDSKDVLRIVHFAQEKWKEQEIKKRMKKRGSPILGIGISNPEELSTLVANNIPVIHIQRECKSLQALQKRHFKEKKIKNRIYLWLTSSLWGILCKFILRHKHRLKKGQDTFHFSVLNQSNVPIPHYMIGGITFTLTIGLCWITKKLLFQHIRTSEYYVHEKEGDFLLIRNDALYSKSQFIIQTIIPSFLIGFSVYYLK